MCVYSECSNVVPLLPVAAIFTPIDFARPGGRKKKLGAFLHTRVWRRTCLDFALSRRKRRQRRGKNEEKMWELEGSLSLSHFAEEGVRVFFLVWPIFSLYLFICETVCWAHFSVPRCERNPFFPCGFFLLRERRRRGFLSSLSSSRG